MTTIADLAILRDRCTDAIVQIAPESFYLLVLWDNVDNGSAALLKTNVRSKEEIINSLRNIIAGLSQTEVVDMTDVQGGMQ